MFAMMHQQHQEKLIQMKESNKQALEISHQPIKQMVEQTTAMYNNLQAAEKEKDVKWNKKEKKIVSGKQKRQQRKLPILNVALIT